MSFSCEVVWQTNSLVFLLFASSKDKQPGISRTCLGLKLQWSGLHILGCCVHEGQNLL